MPDQNNSLLDNIESKLSDLGCLNGKSIFPKKPESNDLIIILDINEFSLVEKYRIYNKTLEDLKDFDLTGICFSVIDKSDVRSLPKILEYTICSWCSNIRICEELISENFNFFIQEKDPKECLSNRLDLKNFLNKTKIPGRFPMYIKSFRGRREQALTDLPIMEDLIDHLGYCSLKNQNGFYRTNKIDKYLHTVSESSADDCKVDLHRFIKKFQGNLISTEFKSQNWRRLDEDYMKSHVLDIKTLEDSKERSYLFFKNCILSIDKDYKEITPLEKLDDSIFVKTECKYNLLDYPKDIESGEFFRFFKHICNENKERELALRTAIGYLLHRFHSGNPKAIVLVDESTEENTGGTGKGILWHAIEQMRNLVSTDCRNECNWNSNFRFSEVKENTSVFVYDEMTTKHWDDIFKTITDGMTVECKYKEKFTIPPDKSPKILITSNFAPMGISSSFTRRRAVYELSNYYSDEKTPLEEFGHWFFSSDWSPEEWNKFYWFMAECLQDYLRYGLMEMQSESLELKKMENVPEKYRDFLEDNFGEINLSREFFISSKELKERYFSFCGIEQSERKKFLGTSLEKELASSLKIYCKIKKIKISQIRKTITEEKERVFERGFLLEI